MVNSITTKFSIKDVIQALSKFSQTPSLDEIGDPTDYDNTIAPHAQEMFISQEDSKLDSFSPQNSQQIGRTQSYIPAKSDEKPNKNLSKKIDNISGKMQFLTDEINKFEK